MVEDKFIRQVWKNTGTGQFLITIPKSADIKEGDFIIFQKYIHPTKQKLENLLGKKVKIYGGKDGLEIREGIVKSFKKNFVLLDRGQAIDLNWIKSIEEL